MNTTHMPGESLAVIAYNRIAERQRKVSQFDPAKSHSAWKNYHDLVNTDEAKEKRKSERARLAEARKVWHAKGTRRIVQPSKVATNKNPRECGDITTRSEAKDNCTAIIVHPDPTFCNKAVCEPVQSLTLQTSRLVSPIFSLHAIAIVNSETNTLHSCRLWIESGENDSEYFTITKQKIKADSSVAEIVLESLSALGYTSSANVKYYAHKYADKCLKHFCSERGTILQTSIIAQWRRRGRRRMRRMKNMQKS